ncbi:MAG: hypothetical protein HC831_07515, partial [Chloroflexia bacterium]|nr:hypothetical protein [Chloroflexia bacterium]
MFGYIKKWLNYILTGSFTVVFAACYGADMTLENPKLINAKDDKQNPIPGLKVTLFENRMEIDEKFTDQNGSVEFYYTQNNKYSYKVSIE